MSGSFTPPATPDAIPQINRLLIERERLLRSMRSGADWFFWIAALSVVNSVISLTGASSRFIIGFGVTQFVDGIVTALVRDAGSASNVVVHTIGFVLNLVPIGLFVLLGFLGRRRRQWAFLLGMILYALDGLIFLIGAIDVLSIAFHLFALWGLYNGLRAAGTLQKMDEMQAVPALS